MYRILFFLFSILFFSNCKTTQSTVQNTVTPKKAAFEFGAVEEFHSTILNEKRKLNIYLPTGYHPDSVATYPVIYLLDGSVGEDFLHISGLVEFMNLYNVIPKSIVVGIANVDRKRDFTYPSKDSLDLKDLPTSGGGENFINFLEKEVQPFINKNYKTTTHKTIIGQSLGGLIATEILMKRPALFDDYIIISPSLWWDRAALLKKADDYLQQDFASKKRIFISLGTEHPVMQEVADGLVNAIDRAKNENIQMTYQPYYEETHATILHIAVYYGFKELYKKK